VAARTTAGSDEASVSVQFVKGKAPVVNITAPRDGSSTDVAEITLAATVQHVVNSRNVTVQHNGRTLTDVQMDRGGNLTAKTTLNEGKNTFIVRATNTEGSDEKTVSVTYSPKPQMAKPEVGFLQPKKSGSKVQSATYSMKANVKGAERSKIRVTFNGKPLKSFVFNIKDGMLSSDLTLKEGLNMVQIEATNDAGTTTAQTDLTYTPVATTPKPEVQIESASQPVGDPLRPGEARSTVIATTKQVSSADQIVATIDGTTVTGIQFNAATGGIQFTVRVKQGATNEVKITVTTPAGTATATRKIAYN
jgi:hypothetical protein